jgi:hypothetical protein
VFFADVVGLGATLLAVALVCSVGWSLARLLLGEVRCRRDPLALSIGALALAIAQGTLLALALGALGLLRIDLAIALEGLFAAFLAVAHRRRRASSGGEAISPVGQLIRRAAVRLREHPLLALIGLHAVGSEALRGLLRPPLSWDSLMYHLVLTADWLQQQAVSVLYGMPPMNYYGYVPANGSLWLWWWMAPSHSELYVNLAMLPALLLLGLAAGGVARELGAIRSWPLASYLVLLTPTVVRFAATEYVDILLAAMIVAGTFFALHWITSRPPTVADAVLAGIGFGYAAGTKVLGPPYAVAATVVVLLVARGNWGARSRQLAAALLAAVACGSYFYLRNILLGVGALAMVCAGTAGGGGGPLPTLPQAGSLAANLPALIHNNGLIDAILGTAVPTGAEIGIGPQFVILALALFLPWLTNRVRRPLAWVLWFQIVVELAFWVAVPEAIAGHVYANVRYLIPALAFAVAGLLAAAEQAALPIPRLATLAGVLLIQDLLMLHAEMPREVRVVIAALDAVGTALLFSERLRLWVLRYRYALVTAVLVGLLAGAPSLASYRRGDRARAFASEFTAHDTVARTFAQGWGWLDRHGDSGTVAVATSPGDYFLYPAMGMRLERRVVYANINRADYRSAARYPGCVTRVAPDPAAWITNLEKLQVRWVFVGRFAPRPFLLEEGWAHAHPERFALRYSDNQTHIYEFLPTPGP